MRFETKIVVAVRDDLSTWQKLNVVAFLAGGIGGADATLMGEPYRDASGTVYGRLIRQPILVFAGDGAALKDTLARALDRGVRPHVYAAGMFATGHDAANREVVAATARDDIDLVGLGFHAERKVADKITTKLVLHP